MYATLHVVGSDNNLGDVNPDPVEFAARDAATNEWLGETFESAERSRAEAVLLVIQANPGFDAGDPTRSPQCDPRTLLAQSGQPDGFTAFLRALREETVAFRNPVVMVHWTKVIVYPGSREVFAFQPQIVPANRVAVP